jgi:protocatechuate 3,4-dioxygenase beta subunit
MATSDVKPPPDLELPPRPKPVALLTPLAYQRTATPDPDLDTPAYKSSVLRHPKQPLVYMPQTLTEITGPRLGDPRVIGPLDTDLTHQHGGEPIGERIIVQGRVMDTEGKPLRNTLVEIWQANAAGRYRHHVDRWPAPLDPNFSGAGRCVTDDEGRYRFLTIKPGPYPWGNGYNAWRQAHIHFSLMGRAIGQRLVTQMFFPGDPWAPYDPIFMAVRDEQARNRMVAGLSIHDSEENWAVAYSFDIFLRGPAATPIEERF